MLLAPFALACLVAPQGAPSPERPAVEVPIQAYFRYHKTGDPKGLVEAFIPEALLQWTKEGARQTLTQEAWRKSAAEKLAKDPNAKRPEVKCVIAWLEVAGEAATAKVILDYPTFRFIDYLHLLKLNGQWKIVDKVYHREEGKH
jgi:hypothetical protein